jgi:hypothetical protein
MSKAIMPKMMITAAQMKLRSHQVMRMQNRKSHHVAAAAVGVARNMTPLMARLAPTARSTNH